MSSDPPERVIAGPGCVAEGMAWLGRVEPRFATLAARTGPWPLRLREPGFAALVEIVAAQQLSTQAAAAIAGRLRAAGLVTPDAVAASDEGALVACGLSRPKARAVRAIAEAEPDLRALAALPTDRVVATLVTLPGIGRWSAEIYALFALGRADAWPAGDLALQEAARALFDRPDRPREAELRALARPWSPWRGVAARGLWTYYRLSKGKEGIL